MFLGVFLNHGKNKSTFSVKVALEQIAGCVSPGCALCLKNRQLRHPVLFEFGNFVLQGGYPAKKFHDHSVIVHFSASAYL